MSRTIKRRYRGSRRFDSTCRNHGSCPWCRSNRLHKHRKRDADAKGQVRDYVVEGAENR